MRHYHSFSKAEIFVIGLKSWTFLDEKILLDLCGFNSVVNREAFRKRVTNHVPSDLDVTDGRRCIENHRRGTCRIDGYEHRIQSSNDRVDKLICSDSKSMSDFCSEGTNEEVLVDFPTCRSCLDVEVNFLKGATVVEIVHRFVARELSYTTILGEESLRVCIPHSQEFL